MFNHYSFCTVTRISTVVMYLTLLLTVQPYTPTMKKCAMGVFYSSTHQLLPSKALLWVTECTAKHPLGAAAAGSRRAPGAWVNTGQSSQHKRHTGLCKAAVGHLATSQRSVPALWATTAVTLRIEVAGVNPMACWRNADCGERSSKTWNEAREE